ncbi:MAG: tetratricopeptide repeat protein [Bacteroidales bacterium]
MKKIILHIILVIFPICVFAQNSQPVWFEYLNAIDTQDTATVNNFPDQLSKPLQSNTDMAVYLAKKLYEAGFVDQLEPIINMHGHDADMKYYAALYYAHQNKVQKAMDFLSDHIQASGRKPRGTIRSADAFDRINATHEWQNFWKQDHYRQRDLNYEAALNFYHDGKYNWALEELNPLLAKYPSDHTYVHLASRIYDKSGNTRLALKYAEKAVKARPHSASYNATAAQLYLKGKKHAKALDAIEAAIRYAPWVPDHYPVKAKALIANKKYADATETLENYCRAFSDTEGWYLMAKAKYHQKKYHDVIRWMNKTIASDKSRYKYFVMRADAFRETRSYENAYKDYAMALDINPKLPQVYINYGLARFEAGDTEGACYLWRKALHYKHPDANDYLYRHCPQQEAEDKSGGL